MFGKEEKNTEFNDYIDILNRMIETQKDKKKAGPIVITICITGGIGSIMLVALLCYTVIKSSFTLESILSTLLAFFSIFISIFFYFKADETSTSFYNSSYEFMKDISVTLGKIEERFGEKLNNLNEKITHLDNISTERSVEIEDEKENKDKIINELMNKANLNEEEKKRYKEEIEIKEQIIDRLKREQFRAQREAARLREKTKRMEFEDRWEPSKEYLIQLLSDKGLEISRANYDRLKKLGYLNNDGLVNKELVFEKINDEEY